MFNTHLHAPTAISDSTTVISELATAISECSTHPPPPRDYTQEKSPHRCWGM